MKKVLLLIAVTFILTNYIFAQPQRELRSVWLTSVYNIDWPHSTNASADAQKARLIEILDALQAANFNAVMFQVRPNADALYESSFEPWSSWITGVRGQKPSYDPLALVIQEANKRGMEVHAWLNPYRYEITAGQYTNLPGDYLKSHPELIITYNGKTYFDPGMPATTQLIKKVVGDLITKYDLDGVIFDDYFYPSNLPASYDQITYNTYGTKEFVSQWYNVTTTLPSRGDFRRASVNNMVREVNDTIKKLRPAMVFGVSPAGIYSTSHSAATHWGTTLPTGITGADNYNTINCDPLAWLSDRSVDYISPQLYWAIGGSQDFVTLTNWWGKEAKRRGRHNYPSLAPYKMYESPFWQNSEIGNQIIANRNNTNNLAQGLIFYNTRSTVNTQQNLAAYLGNDLFVQRSIFPEMAWLPSVQEGAPRITEVGVLGDGNGKTAGMSIANSPVNRFLLYGWNDVPGKDAHSTPDFMQVIFGKDFSEFYHLNMEYFSIQEFMPNRELGSTSGSFNWLQLAAAQVLSPINQTVCDNFVFSWQDVPQSQSYKVQIALQQNPGAIIYSSPDITTNSFILDESILEGQKNYLFRVMAKADQTVSWSKQNSFSTGFPVTNKINSPASNAQNVKLSPTFQWSVASGSDSYHLQIATDASFSAEALVTDQKNINFNIYTATLQKYNTVHYARVRSVNACGYAAWSPVITFTTLLDTYIANAESHLLKTYPNPVSGICRIDYPEQTASRVVSVFDPKGRLMGVYHQEDAVTSEEFDFTHLSPGFYLIRIETAAGQRYMTKIIKSL